MPFRSWLLWLSFIGSAGCLSHVSAVEPVRIAAASDLDFAMREIVAAFEARYPGVRVQLQLGSSGNFYMQIRQGLPVDLFFSADSEFPERLEQAGLVESGTRRLYAVGRLALWASERLVADGLDPERVGIALLEDPRVERLAIANPVHAPYGRAAVTLLEHYGYATRTQEVGWHELQGGLEPAYDLTPLRRGKPRFSLLFGENVSQAAQIAISTHGVGIVAYSLVLSDEMRARGRYWLAPLESHIPLEQTYVILKGRDRPEVRAFYDFVASRVAREIFERYRFILP
jgi:molybdate transport system substrate-binding protein